MMRAMYLLTTYAYGETMSNVLLAITFGFTNTITLVSKPTFTNATRRCTGQAALSLLSGAVFCAGLCHLLCVILLSTTGVLY